MLGLPKSPSSNSPQPAPSQSLPTGPLIRIAFLAVLLGSMIYVVAFWSPTLPIDPSELAVPPAMIEVPQIDHEALARVKDRTHEDRLFLEGKPLGHLLELSLNISPDIADALGRPAEPVEIADLRQRPDFWRGRWIFYKGRVEALSGPRKGHPVDNYDIYEATLRLANGETVLFTFSKPPNEGVHVGGWARAEGFLLKLRDASFPRELSAAPFLVGKQLQRDFDDWGPVTEIDAEILSRVIDTRLEGDRTVPSADAWRSIDDDQRPPLWHLGAFAMAHEDIPLEEWRRTPILNAHSTWEAYKLNEVERGTPQRIIGTLVMSRSISAQPNPAGIKRWTEAWLQVRDLSGKTIPVWIPKKVDRRIGTTLEVRGYYFRRYAYESRRDKMYWTPLFVAAGLPVFDLDTGPGMREIGWIALSGTSILILLAFFGAHRESKRAKRIEQALVDPRPPRPPKTHLVGKPAKFLI